MARWYISCLSHHGQWNGRIVDGNVVTREAPPHSTGWRFGDATCPVQQVAGG
jgi:hypothetical protein